MKILNLSFLSLISICALTACEKQSNSTAEIDTVAAKSIDIEAELTRTINEFTDAMFTSGAAAIGKTKDKAQSLNTAIEDFLNTPNKDTLATAQKLWLNAVLSYREFYFYRQVSFVAPETFNTINKLDYQIASFPIQPGFLDKVGEYKYSGLVHNIDVPMDEQSLTHHHGLTDTSDVVLGLYAIEFLLFSAGEPRLADDFFAIAELSPEYIERGFKSTEETPNNRRRKLLSLQANILISDLTALEKNWIKKGKGSIRNEWENTYFGRMTNIASQSIAVGLSEILLEINELNATIVDTPSISATIKSHDFLNKQRFIGNALASIKSNIQLLSYEKKTHINSHLSKAIELTTKTALTEKEDESEHWKALFSHVKNAGNVAMR